MQVIKIFDPDDTNYETWYATPLAIQNYLTEHKKEIPNYRQGDGILENLERYGLIAEWICVEEF